MDPVGAAFRKFNVFVLTCAGPGERIGQTYPSA